jgi:hypothetical protein
MSNLKQILTGLAVCNLTDGGEPIPCSPLDWVLLQAEVLDDVESWDDTQAIPWHPVENFTPSELFDSADDHALFAERVLTQALEKIEAKLAEQGVDLKGLRLVDQF